MRRMVVVLLLVALVLPMGGCFVRTRRSRSHTKAATVQWQEYRAEDGSFTALFPGTVGVEKLPCTTADKVKYGSKIRGGGSSVVVYTVGDDERAKGRASDPKFLQRVAEGRSKQVREIQVGGLRALELTWTPPQSVYHYRGRVLLAHEGHRLFLVQARWTGPTESPDALKFLDSFKVGTYTPPPVTAPAGVPSVVPSPAGSTAPEAAEDEGTLWGDGPSSESPGAEESFGDE